jgi:uncharacterized membrane protein
MLKLIEVGRVLFGIALVDFGIQYVIFATGQSWPLPGPPWYPSSRGVAGVVGMALLGAGVSIVIRKQAEMAAWIVATLFAVRVVAIHLPRLLKNIHDPGPWTTIAEVVALCGGALILVGVLGSGARRRAAVEAGRWLYALPLIVFAVQHFMYARFVATLVPSWIPGQYFWALFVGAAFIAAAAAIMTGLMASLASMLLGMMFGSWFFILHLPRVVAKLHDGKEWTSAFVALAMSGCALMLAGAVKQKK